MELLPDQEPNGFAQKLMAALLKLPRDAETDAAQKLLRDEFIDRVTAISISPFTRAEREELLTRARNDYLEELDSLAWMPRPDD
jgi:hypothetical protein